MTDLLPMAATLAMIACCLYRVVRAVRLAGSCDWMQNVFEEPNERTVDNGP